MFIPEAEEGKFIIITAELSTGIVLNNDGSRYTGGGNNYYQIFDDKSKVEKFFDREFNEMKRNIELIVYNHNAGFIEVIRPV
jgi:hypothetical protein